MGCKLYHKTTWFETVANRQKMIKKKTLQIISQNYVVWNKCRGLRIKKNSPLQIISQNYVVWNFLHRLLKWRIFLLQIISQNYVVWNCQSLRPSQKHQYVANYITKLRGLKPGENTAKNLNFVLQIISQNYVVWNVLRALKHFICEISCKLYHKTTWFETIICADLSLENTLQIISQNYVVWNW